MKIEISKDGISFQKIETGPGVMVTAKEVFSGFGMETEEGNLIGLCMRDDTFEINVLPKGAKGSRWFRVDMRSRTIEPL